MQWLVNQEAKILYLILESFINYKKHGFTWDPTQDLPNISAHGQLFQNSGKRLNKC